MYTRESSITPVIFKIKITPALDNITVNHFYLGNTEVTDYNITRGGGAIECSVLVDAAYADALALKAGYIVITDNGVVYNIKFELKVVLH